VLFFIIKISQAIGATIPFYLLAYLFSFSMPFEMAVAMYVGVTVFAITIVIYAFIIYYSDCLVITNKRIIHRDWISPFKNREIEVNLEDIQDIETEENGLFGFFAPLDFGVIKIETASTKTRIVFDECFNPEGIRRFVYKMITAVRNSRSSAFFGNNNSHKPN